MPNRLRNTRAKSIRPDFKLHHYPINTSAYSSGTITCTGTETIDGIAINLLNDYYNNLITGSTGNLTLGSTASINGSGNVSVASLVNQGTIDANGGYLNINTQSFSSSNSLAAINGGILEIESPNWTNTGAISTDGSSSLLLEGNWTNNGTITGASGGTINLGGTFSPSSIGTLNANGAVILVSGTFDNTNNNFSIPGAGSLLISGAVTGGTITAPAGQPLYMNTNGILSGVQVVGSLEVQGYSNAITPDTTISTGNIAIDISGELTFAGTQTRDNTNIDLEGVLNSGPNTSDQLTLGSHTTVTYSLFSYFGSIGGNAVVNDGNIVENPSLFLSSELYIDPRTFTNHGTVSAANGVTVAITATNWTNDGQITADGMSTIQFSGAWSNTGTVAIASGGTLNLGGTFATSSLAGITANGASTNISGAMDNSNAAFIVDGTLGSVSVTGSITGGSVEVKANQTLFEGSTTSITSAVTIDANAALLGSGTIAGPSLVNHGTIRSLGNLAINSDSFQNDGTIALSSNEIITSGILDIGQGTLTGPGTISAATLMLDNDPSTLLVDLDAGSSSDVFIDVAGNLVLGGNLEITFSNGLDGTIDSSTEFDVIGVENGYSMIGDFLNVAPGGRLESADGLGSFEVDYGGTGDFANGVYLTNFEANVPEPTSIALLAVGSIGLLHRRQRHRSAP